MPDPREIPVLIGKFVEDVVSRFSPVSRKGSPWGQPKVDRPMEKMLEVPKGIITLKKALRAIDLINLAVLSSKLATSKLASERLKAAVKKNVIMAVAKIVSFLAAEDFGAVAKAFGAYELFNDLDRTEQELIAYRAAGGHIRRLVLMQQEGRTAKGEPRARKQKTWRRQIGSRRFSPREIAALGD